MKKSLLFVISLILSVLIIGCGSSDSSSSENSATTIKGYVVDDPIVNATIKVYDENGKLVATKENATDNNGSYSITLNKNIVKYFIIASGGKINGKSFNGTLYNICFDNHCNITPVTSIIALNFSKNIKNINKTEMENFAKDTLGISDYLSTNLKSIKNMRNYVKEHNQTLDYVISVVSSDVSDGYADNNLTSSIFPKVKIRKTVTKTFHIDTKDINNYQNRNLKLVNLITGEKVDINQPIDYKDYGLNIALVEDYNYTLYDGSEYNASNIIYLPFKPYSDNKLDVNSTVYYYIFLNPELSSLTNIDKKNLINILNTKYKDLLTKLMQTYKNYINYGNVYKNDLNSQISFIQNTLIKNELTQYQTDTSQSSAPVSATVQEIVSKASSQINFNDINKNFINFGGLSLKYNTLNKKYTVKNILPMYYALTTDNGYNQFISDGGDQWLSSSIIDSFNHQIINENVGDLAGLTVSSVFSKISDGSFGGEPTDVDLDTPESYVLYKNFKLSSLQGILNDMDVVFKLCNISVNSKTYVNKIEKNVKKIQNTQELKNKLVLFFDTVDTFNSISDSVLSIGDLFTNKHLLNLFHIPYNSEEINNFSSNIEKLKSLNDNVNKLASEAENIINQSNVIIPEPKTFKEQLSDTADPEKLLEDYLTKFSGGKYKFAKTLTNLGKIPTYDGESHKRLILAVCSLFYMDNKNFENYYYKYILNRKWDKTYFASDNLAMNMYIIFNAMKAQEISNDAVDAYAKLLAQKGFLKDTGTSVNRFDIYKATTKVMTYFTDLNYRKNSKTIFGYIKGVNTSLSVIYNKIKSLADVVKVSADFINSTINSLHNISVNGFSNFLWTYIIKPSLFQGIDNTESILKDKIQDMLNNFVLSGGFAGKALQVANIAGGKAIAFLAFPNKISFNVKTDNNGKNVYFSSAINGITPVVFEKGIIEPWGKDADKQQAFLKKPSNSYYYGVIVASKNNPSWYKPYFETVFKEPAAEVRGKLDNFDERTFAAVNWEYEKCDDSAVINKYSIDESKCQNFNNDELSYIIKGDDIDGGKGGDEYLGYHDKFVLPYPDKNGDPYKNGSYFDFFDYLAVKFSNGSIDAPWGPGLKDSNFAIYNKTRGIYLDKISAKFYAFDDSADSKFNSPQASDVIFKIANANEFDYSVETNQTSVTITNNSDINLSFMIINADDFGSATPPEYYSFDVPANGKKEILTSNISMFGNKLDIIAVDGLLEKYGEYTGDNNLMHIVYSFYNPDISYNITDYFYRYSIIDGNNALGKYPFMRIKKISIISANPPYIANWNITTDNLEANLSVKVTDDNSSVTCNVNWGDGSSNEFKCDENITHTYTNYGEYNATVTAIDDNGLSDKINFLINVSDNKTVPLQIQTQYTLFSGHYPGMLANTSAFAALKNDGTVVTWGDPGSGGDSSSVVDKLTNVKAIYSTGDAFAALKNDGTVVTWGYPGDGGDSSSVAGKLTNVKAIYSTREAFAALKNDGTVVTWGNSGYGGDSSSVADKLTNVKAIYSTDNAFAALKNDGTVVTWGNSDTGGDSSSIADKLTNIKAIYSTEAAFAALKNDGTVVTWGVSADGGNSSNVQNELTDVKTIYPVFAAFAALKNDGTVVTWGAQYNGGDSSSVAGKLTNVKAIYSTDNAFAALKNDGTVVTWGNSDSGGDSSNVQSELTNVKAIYSTGSAFSALKNDGTVVTWGNSGYGGNSSSVTNELHDVVAICSTDGAFAALRKDGTVVTWGYSVDGGDSSSVQNELYNVVSIYSTAGAFAALRKDGTVVTWGDSSHGGNSSSVQNKLHDIVGFSPSYVWQPQPLYDANSTADLGISTGNTTKSGGADF